MEATIEGGQVDYYAVSKLPQKHKSFIHRIRELGIVHGAKSFDILWQSLYQGLWILRT